MTSKAQMAPLSPPVSATMRTPVLRSLQFSMVLVFSYLCFGELMPLPVLSVHPVKRVLTHWGRQEVILLMVLCCLTVLLGRAGGCLPKGCGRCCSRGANDLRSAAALFFVVNIVPVIAALLATFWSPLSENCPTPDGDCTYLDTVLDAVGFISARLARLDLGVSLLLAVRGESAWLYAATGGWLGYAEAIPIHRMAGWWCAGQSALHSVAYLLFYLHTGGVDSLWLNCLPSPSPDKRLNTLGLVNGLGALAFLVSLVLVLPALPAFRSRAYHVFQLLHLPIAILFVVCCAMHDLPILFFAVPGLAEWYFGSGYLPQVYPAKARLLPGTSAPWVELTVDCTRSAYVSSGMAPRGQWALVRVLRLGREFHPLSVAVSTTDNRTELSAVVSAQAGDWSEALAALTPPADSSFDVVVLGPFPGGGSCTLTDSQEPALLLLAGGAGVAGWLPGLAAASRNGRRCHLVWCVQTEGDYLALAGRLPRNGAVKVTVFVTKAAAAAGERLTCVPGNGWGPRATVHAPTGTRHASLVWVSLAATFLGLLVCLLCEEAKRRFKQDTLFGYTMILRLLPVGLTIGAVMLVDAPFRRCLLPCTPKPQHVYGAVLEQGQEHPGDNTQDDFQISLDDMPPVGSRELATGNPEADNGAESPDTECHDLWAGRPDLEKLVRAFAVETEAQTLVVAACGPDRLVTAARRAVVRAQKQCQGLRLEFSGSESSW